jgi:hypothetical protein
MYPMTGSLPDGCARATTGHAEADPAIPAMKSRRRIAPPRQNRSIPARLSWQWNWQGRGLAGDVSDVALGHERI